jgi:hypothetical protein
VKQNVLHEIKRVASSKMEYGAYLAIMAFSVTPISLYRGYVERC